MGSGRRHSLGLCDLKAPARSNDQMASLEKGSIMAQTSGIAAYGPLGHASPEGQVLP